MPKIFDRIREAFNAQPVAASLGDGRPLTSPEAWTGPSHLDVIGELYGIADRSDFPVTRKVAMSLSVPSKSRRVLATNLGRMQLVTRKGTNPAPTMPYLLQPEADRPLSATLTWTADQMFFYPAAWWIVVKRDTYGWPARGGVRLLEREDAETDGKGRLVRAWGQEIGEGKAIKPADVIQFDSPDGGLLVNSAKLLRRAVVLANAASHAEANPVPSINLENTGNDPLNAQQIRDLLDSWSAARARTGVAYTDRSIKATPMQPAVASLLIDGRKQMDLELARACGIPAWAADVALEGATLNYQNRASRAWELIDLYLAQYMTAITSRLSMSDTTPLGWTTTLSTDDLTRPSIKERFETYAIGLSNNFINQAWIDAQEGQPMLLDQEAAK